MTVHDPAGASSVDEVLDTIAHEVRTPLSVVRMAANTLASQPLDAPERDRLLAMIVRNTDLAITLVDRIRRARELEAGDLHLTIAETDPARVARETVEDLADLVLRDRPVRLEATSCPRVAADIAALREILLNLLMNAAQHSPPGAAIEVRVETGEDAVSVIVEDHGSGLDEEDLERVFGKYVSGTGRGGMGLGLYIARQLARAQGGELGVRAGGGAGSAFVLRLPRFDVADSAPAPVGGELDREA